MEDAVKPDGGTQSSGIAPKVQKRSGRTFKQRWRFLQELYPFSRYPQVSQIFQCVPNSPQRQCSKSYITLCCLGCSRCSALNRLPCFLKMSPMVGLDSVLSGSCVWESSIFIFQIILRKLSFELPGSSGFNSFSIYSLLPGMGSSANRLNVTI